MSALAKARKAQPLSPYRVARLRERMAEAIERPKDCIERYSRTKRPWCKPPHARKAEDQAREIRRLEGRGAGTSAAPTCHARRGADHGRRDLTTGC